MTKVKPKIRGSQPPAKKTNKVPYNTWICYTQRRWNY